MVDITVALTAMGALKVPMTVTLEGTRLLGPNIAMGMGGRRTQKFQLTYSSNSYQCSSKSSRQSGSN
jgi:hypothetical protein